MGGTARYREIADQLVERIDKALLRPGDRVPSIREVTRRDRVSPGTVMRAYRELEARGEVDIEGSRPLGRSTMPGGLSRSARNGRRRRT
jgi:DNA-binding transcriptional regulator YhcF (GntR family)